LVLKSASLLYPNNMNLSREKYEFFQFFW
jgi:hypothetical protein